MVFGFAMAGWQIRLRDFLEFGTGEDGVQWSVQRIIFRGQNVNYL
jgi:hypothetical protein